MNAKITVILLALFITACAPAHLPTNETLSTTNETAPRDLSLIAQKGDLVTINYVLSLENGTVVDTNNEALAKEHGVKNYPIGPYSFILGQSGKIAGFDSHIEGIMLGEHKDVIIPPSEPELILALNKTLFRPVFITIPITQRFPKTAFQNIFGKKPVIGDVAYNKTLQFKYQVLNVTEDAVLAKIIAKPGEEYELQNTYWPSEIIAVREKDILFRQKPKENQTIYTEFGPAVINLGRSRFTITHQPKVGDILNKSVKVQESWSIPQQFQVIEVTDDGFVIKRYGSLTDKTLLLSVDLLDLTKDVKKVNDKQVNIIGGSNTGN